MEKNLPWIEDTIYTYWMDTMTHLFPRDATNKIFVYFIGYCHLIGALVLQYGILFIPSKYLWIYLIFAIINIVSYIYIFKNNCFMTLLTNYYGNVKGSALYIRKRTALIGLGINIILCCIGIINPKLAPINITKRIFDF